MMNQVVIERTLTLNGSSPTAPEAEIREVLTRAKWSEADIEIALRVLRGEHVASETRITAMQQFMRSDGKLSHDTVASILRINMTVDSDQVVLKEHEIEKSKLMYVLVVVFFAFFSAALFLVALMWTLQSGIFHPSF